MIFCLYRGIKMKNIVRINNKIAKTEGSTILKYVFFISETDRNKIIFKISKQKNEISRLQDHSALLSEKYKVR